MRQLHGSVGIFCLVSIVLFSSGCPLNEMEQGALDASVNTPPEHNPPDLVRKFPPDSCFSFTQYQPKAEITKNIDVLFMVDTSGSLSVERTAIGDGVDAFVGALPSDANVRIGIMLAHAGAWSGKLYRYNEVGPFVLDTETMALSDIRAILRQRMANVATENETDGGEVGLYSLSRALDSDKLAESKGLGFFREDAALALVFVADENDICARYPEGVTPVYDPDRKEIPAFNKYCQQLTPESTYLKIRDHQGQRPLLVSGIIYFEESKFPADGENEIAYGYTDIIRANNGLMVDLAGGRVYEGLAQIGSLVTKKLNLITEYPLDNRGREIDESTIQAEIDGVGVPFKFEHLVSELHLTGYAGLENSEVYISYCLKPSQNPETIPVVITKVKVENITSVSAQVTWTTDLFSSSQVEVTESLTGHKWMTPVIVTGVLNHTVALSGLAANTLYSIRVFSAIEGDPSFSGPIAFRTLR